METQKFELQIPPASCMCCFMGARGFSCAVSGFGQVLKKVTLTLTRFFSRLRSSCPKTGRRSSSSQARKKTSGTQCNFFFIPYKTWRTVFIMKENVSSALGETRLTVSTFLKHFGLTCWVNLVKAKQSEHTDASADVISWLGQGGGGAHFSNICAS